MLTQVGRLPSGMSVLSFGLPAYEARLGTYPSIADQHAMPSQRHIQPLVDRFKHALREMSVCALAWPWQARTC